MTLIKTQARIEQIKQDAFMQKLGDVPCILEAMAMENETTAPKTGTVQSVNISEGIVSAKETYKIKKKVRKKQPRMA